MKNSPRLALAAAFLALAACASSGPQLEAGPPGPPSEEDASRLLAAARDARIKKGCAEAAPTYRVLAAMGEGLEPAQHELGECLLTMTGGGEAETALFRDEARFWLTRAAFAGNARAQRTLATLYGARGGDAAMKAEALKWALVYAENGQADLYGYKALPATFAPGLKRDIGPDAVAAAEKFAKDFSPLRLDSYHAPPRERPQQSLRERPGEGVPGGERPRRRRAQ